ncbi:MAG: hypothetical protein AAF065_10270 [Verrucomicrobiota bacterium]
MPRSVRGASWALCCGSGYLSYLCFTNGKPLGGSIFVVLSIFFALFAIFGVKRTLGHILDSMTSFDAIDAAAFLSEIIGSVAEKAGDAISNIDIP